MTSSCTSQGEASLPIVPPVLCDHLEAAGGMLGPALEDFVVDEIPLYAPCGSGDHCYVRLRKRGMTTPDLVRVVARATRVRERDIGVAGLKDKHAVTTQWLSLPIPPVAPADLQLPESVEVVEVSRHTNKLRTGHQAGNRFTLRLVDMPPDGLRRALAIAELLRTRGLRNYFGSQRFGNAGGNLSEAFAWLEGQATQGGSQRGRPRFKEKLLASAVQSEVFNRYLRCRDELGLERPIAGEVVRLNGSAKLFVVDAPDKEEPRLAQRDIHLTGPLPGPKMREADGNAALLEAQAAGELGLSEEAWRVLARFAPGSRRDLLIWPDDLDVRSLGEAGLELRFSLPSGGYATQVLREFTRTPWLGRQRPPASH